MTKAPIKGRTDEKSWHVHTLKNHAAEEGHTTAAPSTDAPQDMARARTWAEESISTHLLRAASQAGKAELRVTESDYGQPWGRVGGHRLGTNTGELPRVPRNVMLYHDLSWSHLSIKLI